MNIALMQYPIEWADIGKNLEITEERIANLHTKVDLVVLPEMFTTGFCSTTSLAEDINNSRTANKLKEWAGKYNLAIFGSFMAKEADKLYNRMFFALPSGEIIYSDKRHLYAHGGEAEFFTAGSQRRVVEYKGVKFCMLACYDLRFPVWSRNASGFDYDVLLYTANWPEIRIKYWDALLQARVIENQCIVCGINRVGDDGLGLHYNGHSAVIDTYLNQLVSFGDNEQATKIATLDINALHIFREHSPLWKDADKFEIIT